MAYDADSVKTQQQQIAGSAPLQSGGAPTSMPMEDQGSTGPSQPSTITSGGGTSQGTQDQGNGNKSNSSGMFTNIQKYISRNKPQAQNIGKAVTQDFSKQAEQIRQVAKQRKDDQAAAIQGGRDVIAKETQEAQNIVNRAMEVPQQAPTNNTVMQQQPMGIDPGTGTQQAPAPQVQAPPVTDFATDQERFQQLMSQGTAAQGVGDLNLAKQNARQQALSNLAGTARSEQGRRNLMQETFGDVRQYTRGQSALDNLILGGSEQAKANLIGGVEGQADQTQNMLNTLRQQAAEDVTAYNTDVTGFKDDVTGIASGSLGEVDQGIQTQYEQELAQRQALADDYEAQKAAVNEYYTKAASELGDVGDLKNIANLLLGSGANLGKKGRSFFGELAKGEASYNRLGRDSSGNLTGTRIGQDHAGFGNTRFNITEDKLENAMRTLAGKYGYDGINTVSGDSIWSDVWRDSKSHNRRKQDQKIKVSSLQNAFKNLKKSLESAATGNQIDEGFQKLTGGQDISSYAKAEGLDKFDFADKNEIGKFNRLKQLLGQEDVVADEMLDTGFTTRQQAKDYLNRFKGTGAGTEEAVAEQEYKRTSK